MPEQATCVGVRTSRVHGEGREGGSRGGGRGEREVGAVGRKRVEERENRGGGDGSEALVRGCEKRAAVRERQVASRESQVASLGQVACEERKVITSVSRYLF